MAIIWPSSSWESSALSYYARPWANAVRATKTHPVRSLNAPSMCNRNATGNQSFS